MTQAEAAGGLTELQPRQLVKKNRAPLVLLHVRTLVLRMASEVESHHNLGPHSDL